MSWVLFLVLSLSPLCFGEYQKVASYDRLIPVKIKYNGQEALDRLAPLDLQFDHHRTREELAAFVTPEQLSELLKMNYTVASNTQEIFETRANARSFFRRSDLKRFAETFYRLETDCSTIPQSELNFNEEFSDYHHFDSLASFMKRVSCAFPEITKLYSIGQSVDERPLLVIEISKNPGINEDEPEFKYVANMHGDEVIGRENLLRFILHLCQGYRARDPRIMNIVDTMSLHILPTMNPDGFEAVKRTNSHWVDLNRNFPDQFRSSFNARQPEVSAVIQWSMAHNFVLSANFHGGAVVVNYPWDGRSDGRSSYYSPSPDDATFVEVSLAYSRANPKMYSSREFQNGITNGAAWYVLYGGMQDWNYVELGAMEVTIELSNNKWPDKSELATFWEDNKESMLKYVEAVSMGFKGHVKDANTRQPLAAKISVAGISHLVKTDSAHGDYYRLIVPGTYQVTAMAQGKKSVTKTVVVEAGKVAILDFEL